MADNDMVEIMIADYKYIHVGDYIYDKQTQVISIATKNDAERLNNVATNHIGVVLCDICVDAVARHDYGDMCNFMCDTCYCRVNN